MRPALFFLATLLPLLGCHAQSSDRPAFIKATSIEQIKDGAEIILVAEEHLKAAGDLIGKSSKYLDAIEITFNDDGSVTPPEEVMIYTIYVAKSGCAIANKEGIYLKRNSLESHFATETSVSKARVWTLKMFDEGVALHTSDRAIVYDFYDNYNRFNIDLKLATSEIAHIFISENSIEPVPNPDNPEPQPEDTTITLGDEVSGNTEVITQHYGETADVMIQRTFANDGGWYTLCLPFDLTAEDLRNTLHASEVRTFHAVSEQPSVTHLYFRQTDYVAAGTPCLVKVAQEIANPVFSDKTIASTTPGSSVATDATTHRTYRFTGIFDALSFADFGNKDDIRFLSGTDGLTLSKPSAEGSLRPFRAYFVLPEDLPNLSIDLATTDMVQPISVSTDNNLSPTYDLLGRRANTPNPLPFGIKKGKNRRSLVPW